MEDPLSVPAQADIATSDNDANNAIIGLFMSHSTFKRDDMKPSNYIFGIMEPQSCANEKFNMDEILSISLILLGFIKMGLNRGFWSIAQLSDVISMTYACPSVKNGSPMKFLPIVG